MTMSIGLLEGGRSRADAAEEPSRVRVGRWQSASSRPSHKAVLFAGSMLISVAA
jgi:hypothetical protein